MSRRLATLAVSSALVLALGAAGALFPVPYVALEPGPATDTLGKSGDKPVIAVEGRRTYPTEGRLDFVTIAYRGSPQDQIGLLTALRGWLDPQVAVVPQSAIFPEDQSVDEFVEQTSQAMTDSQQNATTAALRELGITVRTSAMVRDVTKGYPAHGVLRAGDVIVAVDGTDTHDAEAVSRLVSRHRPGEDVTITVRRDGQTKELRVATTKAEEPPGQTVVGVRLEARHTYPFAVRYSVGDVGGPSAGLMFSLGVIDKLTPGSLTGGRSVAGTGTITADGTVGPIGGVAQKLIGARESGATVFLTPSEDCSTAVRTAPEGLRLIRVETLHGAVESLRALRTGNGPIPSCE
ncbi:MAG: PDZ domain-containing protein [Streptosporangiales bacterium]|nr:PDZ domain-containing protein [Streptosporangiales bacterium]